MTGQHDRDALLTEFLRGSREMVAAQRDVLLAYFGGQAAPSAPGAAPPTVPVRGEHVAHLEAEPVRDEPQPVPEPVRSAPVAGEDLLAAVLQVISDRTGYP
ncbi:hypothetical protein P8605_48615, partial [Streptomyces sp. T-3]|nr:hypothetical protein [Streptomyces sp. T-3]